MHDTDIADSSTAPSRELSRHPLLDVVSSAAVCRVHLPEAAHVNRDAETTADYVVDHGRIQEYNNRFVQTISRLSEDRIEESDAKAVFPPELRELLAAYLQQESELLTQRFTLTGDDDTTRYFEVAIWTDRAEGRISTLWISFNDVTEPVQLKERTVTALEQQQTRLGRELHDSVGQLLTSIRILSENLVGKLPDDSSDESQIARRILDFAQEASEEVSQLEKGLLIPEELSEEGLSIAIKNVADRTNSLPGITCTFEKDIEGSIGDSNTRLHLYRIVQEAVNNAVRHGKPDRVDISLTSTPDKLQLLVSDDGTGFAPSETHSHGLGLDSMRYRAHVIGATLEIDSSINHGTTIRCILVYPQNDS